MNKTLRINLIFTLTGILYSSLFGQNQYNIDTIRELIRNSLKTKLGCECGISDIINLDEKSKPPDSTEDNFGDILHLNNTGYENPYGTLTHCFVFTYYRDKPRIYAERRESVGIFKNDQIIGLLDTAIETLASSSGGIRKISDLNKDGEVDIVVIRALGVSGPPWEGYWIVSWNGKRMRLINAIKDNESVIISPWDYMTFVDLDEDGIYELTTSFEDENGVERDHVYSWNGKLYGEWGKSSKALLKGASRKKSK